MLPFFFYKVPDVSEVAVPSFITFALTVSSLDYRPVTMNEEEIKLTFTFCEQSHCH